MQSITLAPPNIGLEYNAICPCDACAPRPGAGTLREFRPLTGGEPLVRRGIMQFFHAMRRHLDASTLQELTLTTNGSQLRKYAAELADCGVRRINVSLDTLNEEKFAHWAD